MRIASGWKIASAEFAAPEARGEQQWRTRCLIGFARAAAAREYCRLPASASVAPFNIDHIIAKQHGGTDDLSNLAFACDRCNLHKVPNIAGIDPDTGVLTRLLHPRLDSWPEHFEWHAHVLAGRTAVGRTTIRVLALNEAIRRAVRAALLVEGAFPPPLPARE
jgi:hypothetical protein